MTDISELEKRLAQAFDRIGRGVEVLHMQRASAAAAGEPDQDALASLQTALDDEKLANEQLNERVRTLKERVETLRGKLDQAKADLEAAQQAPAAADPALAETLAAQDGALAQLRATSEALRANNDALRAANAAGLGDADLINAGLQAQLDQVMAEREAERVEVQGILDALRPLLEDAAGTEDA